MTRWKSGNNGSQRGMCLLAILLVLNLVSMIAPTRNAVAQERPPLTYFALGDSYASGHGLPDEVGTGEDGAGNVGNCRRSPSAYPYLVARALGETYAVDFGPEHHLACSGATAGPYTMASNDETYHIDKSISAQFAEVFRFLDARDSTGSTDPVLVTITIGVNDIGLTDIDTLRQILRPTTSNLLILPFFGPIVLGPPESAVDFFEWLDAKSAPIARSLTPGIDNLLAAENVYVVLTDYPNPFREGGFGVEYCNDFFVSLTCDEAMNQILGRLNSIMLDQFLQVNDPSHLRVATLGPIFSSHFSECAPFVANENASETWFQPPYTDNIIDNVGACVHPNALGAQAVADAIVPLAQTMLATPSTQASAEMDIGAYGPNGHEIGARFTVTLEDGTYIGECTLEGYGNEPYPLSCYVAVPRYTTVVVTLDESTITPGYAPVENPIFFDTSGDPGAASHWGVSFQIEPLSASSASSWPTDRDDGPGTLFVWLGANAHGFPDWVACDDATTYCLVGYTGGEHLLVQMDGLVVVGTVMDSVVDPRQALLALGLPDEIVTQILGP